MKNLTLALIVLTFFGQSATAQTSSFDSQQLALNLGSIIASEQFCGLVYDQDAIATFIENKVPASDISFPSMLSMMVDGTKYQLNSMSKSAKTAHCTQIRRLAKNYSFLK